MSQHSPEPTLTPRRTRRRLPRLGRKTAVIAAIATVCGVGASVAYASIPDANGVIHGCYNVSNKFIRIGTVRIVNSAADCATTEKAITWSQTGPQGPPGPSVVHANADMGAPVPNCTPPNCNLVPLLAGGGSTVVEQITIPANGTYLLTDKVEVQNENPSDSNNVGCQMELSGTTVDSAETLITGSGDGASLPLQDTTYASAGAVDELVCANDGTDAPAVAYWAHVSAIRIGS